jgi:hypothetical protein
MASILLDERGDPSPRITTAYNTKAMRFARRRMALAGFRLAAILNAKFQ